MAMTIESGSIPPFVRQNRERIEVALSRALKRGVEQPIVLALDLYDPLGLAITEAADGGVELQRHLREAENRGMSPQLIWGLPGRTARSYVGQVNMAVAGLLQDAAPSGMYQVLAIGDGELSIVTLPIDFEV
jgi:hypothetical protein